MTILRTNKRLLLQSDDFEDIVLIIRIIKKKLIFQISGIEQISHLTRFILLMTIIICFSFNGFFCVLQTDIDIATVILIVRTVLLWG